MAIRVQVFGNVGGGLPAPEIAKVGQYLRVLSVDENGKITAVEAEDMVGSYPVVEGKTNIEPGKYYVFGEVNALTVSLVEVDDGMANEYCFEFLASDDFDGFTVTPEPRWTTPVQIVPGKTHQVSILRGIGVMICA